MVNPTEQQCRDYFENVKAGNVDGAKAFVEAFPAFVDMRNTRKDTMMMMAADFGHTSMVGMLLDHGASIDAMNGIGVTAMMNAVMEGHKDTVKLLIDRGAVPEAVSPGLIRSAAKMKGFHDIEQMLEEAAKSYIVRMLKKEIAEEADASAKMARKGLRQDTPALPRLKIKPKNNP